MQFQTQGSTGTKFVTVRLCNEDDECETLDADTYEESQLANLLNINWGFEIHTVEVFSDTHVCGPIPPPIPQSA